jgi:hypothetical protein
MQHRKRRMVEPSSQAFATWKAIKFSAAVRQAPWER